MTQGLAFGAGLPVVPVSDLAALAARAATQHRARHVLACLDARMAQVYWAAFDCADPAVPVALTPERVSDIGDIRLEFVAGAGGQTPSECPLGFFGAGHGFSGYPALAGMLSAGLGGFDAGLLPHAREIALIGARAFSAGATVAPEDGQPVYLRDEVAHRR